MSQTLPFEGILMISDMDRTLVTEDFEIPERNVKAIERFIEKGGHFSLATGRSAQSAGRYLSKVKVNSPCILSNGATIYDFDKKKILWSAKLAESAREIVKKILERFSDVGIEIYMNEQIYIVSSNKWTDRHKANEKIHFEEKKIEEMPFGWQKVLFASDNSKLREIEDFVRSLNYTDCDFVFSNTMYYEMLPKNISKGTVITHLASIMNIDKRHTIGIGDFYNDLTLIKMSGFGATVEGAPDDIKKAADFVAGSCREGAVADVIEYLEKSGNIFKQ
ncbi:HAD-superfamily hydrolase [[Clostridium] cellulosi]|uniref:HAD-superfamily hydrolase n=1 Tax=[Clostridium] cellulosi TaxID=29343 RepID=A0A078KUB0_9FIRM|nr:HAD-superfamily hydrolase [[Clostridium] cellulosi]